MAGMRDYSDAEIDLVRKSFSGRYALRDRAFFEMALQMGLRVSEMLSITVGQVYQFGRIAARFPGSPRPIRISWRGSCAWRVCSR